MSQVDLNQLRQVVLQNQQRGQALPQRPEQKVMVDPAGRIKLGHQTHPAEQRQLSQVHQGTFAWGFGRRAQEAETVRNKMPTNTTVLTVGGVSGYFYRFVNEFGNPFALFAYCAGGEYQVLVVSPEVEQQNRDPHKTHLYPDGTICFGSPMRTLEEAWSKSVLWANGFTTFQRTGRFQFSLNNL